MQSPIILKGDGTKESFDVEKLLGSLRRSGAPEELAKKIAYKVGGAVKDGMSTTAIYRSAFKLLHQEEHVVAARYSMRRAIFDLGPTGFPFEQYIAEVMRAKGYKTSHGVMVQGRCTTHEVDVVMQKGDKTIGAELKFHNTPGFKTDVKTALYVRARYWDIQWGAEDRKEKAGIDEGWLVTNTKFTTNAIEYGECSGIKLLGWSYPNGAGLESLIRETGAYPVTILTTLSAAEKIRLLGAGITMCHMVMESGGALERAGIKGRKLSAVMSESAAVCSL